MSGVRKAFELSSPAADVKGQKGNLNRHLLQLVAGARGRKAFKPSLQIGESLLSSQK